MSLRIYLILSAFIVAQPPAHAIREYVAGDTLYVWAASGLSLRSEAGLNAAKIASIPYGTPLVALSDKYTDAADETRVEAVPGYTTDGQASPAVWLSGRFVRVRFQGKTGYVFDGYLSKLPPLHVVLGKYRDGTTEQLFEDFDTYAQRTFGVLTAFRDSASFSQVFRNGATLICSFPGEEENNVVSTLPNISWQEAFLLFNNWQQYERDVRKNLLPNPSQYPWSHRFRVEATGPVLEFEVENAWFLIRSLDAQKMVIFQWGFSGC